MASSARMSAALCIAVLSAIGCTAAAQGEYRWDDGTGDLGVSYAFPEDLAWFNWFPVQPGLETIGSVRVAFSGMPDGMPFTMHVWADPNGFEDLFGAYLLASGSGVTASGTNQWVVVDIPDVIVSKAFWVGVIFHNDPPDYSPAMLDVTPPNAHHSWIMTGAPILPDDLFSGGGYPYHIETLLNRSGDWLIRADVKAACDGDFNGDGAANTLDVLAFLNAWTTQDPRADFNGDGAVNTLDVLGFLNAWAAGC
ncbi:MAG: hypothetical protein IPJ41_02685 [Phycisphaerales bacterium]|nr:hypothetical protein [Phycisphaerales bacterium]